MKSRTVIHVFYWQIASLMLFFALATPSWGQQPSQSVSSRKTNNSAPQASLTATFDESPKSVQHSFKSVEEAVQTFTFSEPSSNSSNSFNSTSRRRVATGDANSTEYAQPPKMTKPNKLLPLKLPKLADPELFRVQPSKPDLNWEKLQDEPGQSSTDDVLPSNKKAQADSRSTTPRNNADTLSDTLSMGSLHSGIAFNSMQQAVISRNVPDPNETFVMTAMLGPEYADNYQLSTKTWRSPDMFHGQLYFEDANLERYGNSVGVFQPVVSGVKFFSTVAFLPYKIGQGRDEGCDYGLGHYRPGDCNPAYKKSLEISRRGAFYQALGVGVVIGGL